MLFCFVAIACLVASCHGLFNYDAGLPARFQGFGDVNGDGKADFCRFVCPKAACLDRDVIFCCHLSGQTNQCGYSSEPGFESGKTAKPAALVDANGDGRADYCRFLTPPEGGDAIPYCRIAGKTGWTTEDVAFNYVLGQEGFKRRLL